MTTDPAPLWATWANLLTALRLASVPAMLLAIQHHDWGVAAVLFAVAIVTDVGDGKLARYFNQASALGGLLDHATDALFVTAMAWALASTGTINAWLWILIGAAFIQYMLDSRALAGQHLRASALGRGNGIAYFALAGTAIGAHLLDWQWLLGVVAVAAWICVATTLISMGDRAATLVRGAVGR